MNLALIIKLKSLVFIDKDKTLSLKSYKNIPFISLL